MICSHCHKDKEFPEFSRGRVCKVCVTEQKRAYRLHHKRKKRRTVQVGPRRVALSKVQDAQGRWHINWGYE
jgi:hypothetical protein